MYGQRAVWRAAAVWKPVLCSGHSGHDCFVGRRWNAHAAKRDGKGDGNHDDGQPAAGFQQATSNSIVEKSESKNREGRATDGHSGDSVFILP